MAFLELKNVSQSLRLGRGPHQVLADINLQIENGEFVAIVGYSGAGKTTLISLIAGLIPPDSGTITLNDLEITAARSGSRNRFSKLFTPPMADRL